MHLFWISNKVQWLFICLYLFTILSLLVPPLKKWIYTSHSVCVLSLWGSSSSWLLPWDESHLQFRGMVLSQGKYADELATDLHPNSDDTFSYCGMVGALQYLTFTRPDIFCCKQGVEIFDLTHWCALRGCQAHLMICEGYFSNMASISLIRFHIVKSFTKADWVGCSHDRCSTSRFIVFLVSNMISWSVQKPLTVSRSSTKAEYKALANGSTEVPRV